MRFASQAVLLLGTRAFTLLLGLIINLLIARVLGPAGQGVIAIIAILQGIVLSLGDFGLPSAAAYYFKSGKRSERELALGALRVSALMLVVAGLGWWLYQPSVASWMRNEKVEGFDPVWLWLGFAALPGMISTAYLNALLVVGGKNRLYAVWQAGGQVATLGVAALLVLVLRWGVSGALIAQLVGSIAAVGVFAYYVSGLPKKRGEPGVISDLMAQGLQIYPVFVIGFLMKRGETAVLTGLATAEAVGIYATAYMLFELILNIPRTLIWPVMNRISDNGDRMGKATAEAVRGQNVVMIGVALLSAAVFPWLLPLVLGPAFAATGIVILWLLPGLLFRTIHLSVTTYFIAQGQPRRLLLPAIGGATVDIVVALLLIPSLGIHGAAIAALCAEAALALGSTIVFVRHSGVRPAEVLLIGPSDMGRVVKALGSVARRKSKLAEG